MKNIFKKAATMILTETAHIDPESADVLTKFISENENAETALDAYSRSSASAGYNVCVKVMGLTYLGIYGFLKLADWLKHKKDVRDYEKAHEDK